MMKLTTDLKRFVRYYLEATNGDEIISLNEILNNHGITKPQLDVIGVLYENSGLRSVYSYLSSYDDPESSQD